MTMLDKFISFAEGLSAERREAVEAALAALMDSYSSDYEFTPSELAEIDHRVAEPNPRFANPNEIESLFGKSFGA